MDCASHWAQAPADRLHPDFYGGLALVWHSDEHADAHHCSRSARHRRRRHAAPGAVHPAGELSAPASRHGHGRLRHRRRRSSDHRPHPGRMDHRQLLVALDLLHQSSHWRAGLVYGQPVRRRSSLPAQSIPRSNRLSRLWPDGSLAGDVATGARQRAGGGLVHCHMDTMDGGRLHAGARWLRPTRVDGSRTDRPVARVPRPQLCRGYSDYLSLRLHSV